MGSHSKTLSHCAIGKWLKRKREKKKTSQGVVVVCVWTLLIIAYLTCGLTRSLGANNTVHKTMELQLECILYSNYSYL